jgi:hypothetical protein
MRARHKGDRLKFLDVEDAQIRPPAMKAEQWIMIGTEAGEVAERTGLG